VKLPVLFDFDQTLFDTADIIREAYELAGADTTGIDIMREGRRDWLYPRYGLEEGHALWLRKNRIYARLLCGAPSTGILPIAEKLYDRGHMMGIVTGAPGCAADAIKSLVRSKTRGSRIPFHFISTDMYLEDKIEYMQTLSMTGYYVDDDRRSQPATERIGWTYVDPSGCVSCQLAGALCS
jgi:hypothetical protein